MVSFCENFVELHKNTLASACGFEHFKAGGKSKTLPALGVGSVSQIHFKLRQGSLVVAAVVGKDIVLADRYIILKGQKLFGRLGGQADIGVLIVGNDKLDSVACFVGEAGLSAEDFRICTAVTVAVHPVPCILAETRL